MQTQDIIIYYDGPIITMDAGRPKVEALAVIGGRIAAIGSLEEVKLAVGENARLESLNGSTMLPGFIDGHSHFCSGGMNRLYAADCAVTKMEELKATLRKKHDENALQNG